jgi:probable rRNA maturation factor
LRLYFFSEGIKISFLQKRFVAERFKRIAFFEKRIIDSVNFIFVDDKKIKLLNSKYLNHHYPTDTISFNYSQGNYISGDIYIGINTVFYNSMKFQCSKKEELLKILIHGFLHLVGYSDYNNFNKSRMNEMENLYLRLFK